MLRIFDTTLVCADCRDPDAALSAMSVCLGQAEFDDVLFFTDQKRTIYPGKVINIDKISTIQDYSHFIFKKLHNYIKTKHLLICQYDGFIINACSWDHKFYEYDYIGAPWGHHNGKVGNGGFSFRSLRLHKILSESRFDRFHPEDAVICGRYQELLTRECKIKFAPKEIAEKFSLETSAEDIRKRKPFGFHGKSCVNEAMRITRINKNHQISDGIKCYLRPSKYIPIL